MTLEQMLKSKGWTDADLEAAKPLLSDARFRSTIEDSVGAIASERDQLKAKDEEWMRKLDSEYNPAIARAEQDAKKARLEAAQLREQVEIAKQYGYFDTPEAAAKAEAAANAAAVKADQLTNGYDAKKHPTWDDVNRFADAEGRAIAMAHDLAAEYSYLTGGRSLFEYEAVVNGQMMRGLQAVREEAKAARKPLDQFVADKFDFVGKRAEMAQKKQKEHDDAIVKATTESVRAELAQQYSNPNMRVPMPSRQPFIPGASKDAKQPWQDGRTPQERQRDRVAKLVAIQMRGTVVQ
jgi:hypothetical protein